MIDFVRSLFRRENSSATAKERLRLVLLSDHLELSPEIVDALKADLLAVISRYVEIDAQAADVTFEHRDRELAMLASVPVLSVRNDRLRPALTLAPPLAVDAMVAVDRATVADPFDVFSEPVSFGMTQAAEAQTPSAREAQPPGAGQGVAARPRRRRRRRRPAGAAPPEVTLEPLPQGPPPPMSAAQG